MDANSPSAYSGSAFIDVVRRSGLVEEQKLDSAISSIDMHASTSGVVCNTLIDAGLITPWQSEQLLEGRFRGFFLGKYKLLKHIGSGGMGSVYLAEHTVMRRRVAIKVLSEARSGENTYLERFLQEARAVAQLDHPNVVRAYDVDTEGDFHYLVMEYVEGRDLQSIVKREGPLDYRAAADCIRQAALGLAHAHEAGLIHRDVKPANLLRDPAGTVKILDLGLARFADNSGASLTIAFDKRKVIGTVDYLAPEQAINSHEVDARADIYSLGCTLYFVLAGNPPFPEGSLPQRVVMHHTAQPRSLRELRPDVPEALVRVSQKMMAKAPADRYQSAADIAADLDAWLAHETVPPAVVAINPLSPPSLKSAPAKAAPDDDLTLAPLDDEPPAKRTKPSQRADAAVRSASDSGANIRLRDPTQPRTDAKPGHAKPGDSGESVLGKKPTQRAHDSDSGSRSIVGQLLDELLDERTTDQPHQNALDLSDCEPPRPVQRPKTTLTAPRRAEPDPTDDWDRYSLWFLMAAGVLLAGVLLTVAFSTYKTFENDIKEPAPLPEQSFDAD